MREKQYLFREYCYQGLTIDVKCGSTYLTKIYDSEEILIEQLTKHGRSVRHLVIFKRRLRTGQNADRDVNHLIYVGYISYFNREKKKRGRNWQKKFM